MPEEDREAFNRWWRKHRRGFHVEMQFLDCQALLTYLRLHYPKMTDEELRHESALFQADRQRSHWLLTHPDNSRWN